MLCLKYWKKVCGGLTINLFVGCQADAAVPWVDPSPLYRGQGPGLDEGY